MLEKKRKKSQKPRRPLGKRRANTTRTTTSLINVGLLAEAELVRTNALKIKAEQDKTEFGEKSKPFFFKRLQLRNQSRHMTSVKVKNGL